MTIAICRLMGLALGPQLPPLDVKIVMMMIDTSGTTERRDENEWGRPVGEGKKWGAFRESNSGPRAPKARIITPRPNALPDKVQQPIFQHIINTS